MTTTAPDPAKEIDDALSAAPYARTRFNALPPSHRQEYLAWIGEAKKPATRARRIAGMIERLSANKTR